MTDTINSYITKRYNFLSSVAKNIVSAKKKNSNNKKEDAHDLLCYIVEFVCSRRDKFEGKDESELEALFIGFMWRQWNWQGSSKNSFNRKNALINSGNGELYEIEMPDNDSIDVIEMEAEDIPEIIKDYMLDLINTGYSNEHIAKILSIKDFYKTMNVSEQSLYDLYFMQGYSMRAISSISGVPLSSVGRMLMAVKEKLRNNYLKISS